MKKVLSIVICLILLPILICLIFPAACSPRKKDTNTITLWHWMTDRQEAFETLAAKYEEQTGIKVKVDLDATSDAYKQSIWASAQAKALPDIYRILHKKQI